MQPKDTPHEWEQMHKKPKVSPGLDDISVSDDSDFRLRKEKSEAKRGLK